MNRVEVHNFLKSFFAETGKASGGKQKPPGAARLEPFLDLILSLKRDLPLSIPLLRDLAVLVTGKDNEAGLLKKRIERRYRRLCRISSELGRLDLKKAAGISMSTTHGATQSAAGHKTLEDFVFSQIDFSRYRKMSEKDFDMLFPESLEDFDESFLKKNFGLDKTEIKSAIEGSYKKTEGEYRLQRETPLVLSVMRTLETSLEAAPLFTAGEIKGELQSLLGFLEGDAGSAGKNSGKNDSTGKAKLLSGIERLYPLLVSGLDNVIITHGDSMTTKLFISPNGDLSGTFRPAGKPWTLVLIPAELINYLNT